MNLIGYDSPEPAPAIFLTTLFFFSTIKHYTQQLKKMDSLELVFELLLLDAKIKDVVKGYSVAMVTY